MKLSFRLLCLLGFLGCMGGLGFALYLQHYKGYEPCPMCIFQRVAMLGAALMLLIGAIHGPKGGGRWVYVFFANVSAIAGALIAWRHVWLQGLPEDQRPACGPTLDYLLDMMPLQEAVRLVLSGDGNCAIIDAQWLGLSLPFWTMVAFIALIICTTLIPVVAKKTEARTLA